MFLRNLMPRSGVEPTDFTILPMVGSEIFAQSRLVTGYANAHAHV